MGRITDRAGIQFRVLNRRGPPSAGQGQADRHSTEPPCSRPFPAARLRVIEERSWIWSSPVVASSPLLATGDSMCSSVVLMTGTFLSGLIHIGGAPSPPAGMASAECRPLKLWRGMDLALAG
jgi:tRNA uridine 5-carboxymethylaminomethyl modification enzyme